MPVLDPWNALTYARFLVSYGGLRRLLLSCYGACVAAARFVPGT